jgi:predicted TIM-barrel fold metal-dependent hydrolase
VDIAVIDWLLPQQEFHAYLKRLIDAGFAKRIMFGSDNMVWPDAIDVAIDNVNAVPFLTAGQKRDILYNNAARFLRLDVPVASR